MRRIPPLGTIEAFVVGSRERSFRAAADRLALSPSAFSRRIKLLEAFVGTTLFERTGTCPVLTPAGQRYLADLEPAVEVIRRGTDALRTSYRQTPLRVSASLSVATAWLLPRLRDFLETHDGMPIVVSTADRTAELRSGDADIALVGDSAPPEGFASCEVLRIEATPLAAPAWLSQHGMLTSITDLAQHELLTTSRPAALWQRWANAFGHCEAIAPPARSYETIVMTYEAAAAGLGITLGAPLVAERFVTDGRLVACFDGTASVGSSYYLAYASKAVRDRADARCFTSWISQQAGLSQAAFNQGVAITAHR